MASIAFAPFRPSTEGLPKPIAINLRGVSVAEWLRAALSTAVIVALNEWLDWPPVMEAALAALFTRGTVHLLMRCRRSNSPPAAFDYQLRRYGRPDHCRLRPATRPLSVVIPLACVCMFATSFARIYRQAAMQVGNLCPRDPRCPARTRTPTRLPGSLASWN
jgi:hypothetical protein